MMDHNCVDGTHAAGRQGGKQSGQGTRQAEVATRPQAFELVGMALRLAKSGHPVFPVHGIDSDGNCACGNRQCRTPGKHPVTKHGLTEATTNSEQIAEWWKNNPLANIGMRTDSVLVLDVDPRSGGDESFYRLQDKYGTMPETSEQTTGSGGKHFIFKLPENANGLHSSVPDHDGLDIRSGSRHYIVVAPSWHKDGNRYRWTEPIHPSVSPPEWLVDLITKDSGTNGQPGPRMEVPETITDGERNTMLYRLGCKYRADRHSDNEIRAFLTTVNSTRCNPPMELAEIESIVESATKHPPGHSLPVQPVNRGPQPPVEQPFEPPPHWEMFDVFYLAKWDVPPLQPLIEGMVAKGNMVLVAAPSQAGKTLFAVNLSKLLIHGGMLFDRFRVEPVKSILYIVLEDPKRRIHARLKETLVEFPKPDSPDQLHYYVSPGLVLTNSQHQEHLEDLIHSHNVEVVFLDTYQKTTPGITSFDDAQQSGILHFLSNLTRKKNITLFILDHVRKADSKGRKTLSMDDIKGTGGKAQNSDTNILLAGESDTEISFQCFSKDFDKPVRLLLEVAPENSDPPKYRIVRELDAQGQTKKEEGRHNKERVFEALPERTDSGRGGWVDKKHLIDTTGFSEPTVRRHLGTLVGEGRVDSIEDGRTKRYARVEITPGTNLIQ